MAAPCFLGARETYLSKVLRGHGKCIRMKEKRDSGAAPPGEGRGSDLARRLARFRRRVEAEGRPRSVKLIDRAIEDADGAPGGA